MAALRWTHTLHVISEKVAANERIRAIQIELGLDDSNPLPFLCECDDIRCRTVIRLRSADYGEARASPVRFVVVEGHPYQGTPIVTGEGYFVVEGRPMNERAKKIGENEALYRSINEKIEDLNRAFGVVTESMGIVCECGELACTQQIDLDIPTYERVRADPTLFVVVPGHEIPDVESVVEPHGAFNIIRKDSGTPAELARELDPRS